MAYCYAYVFHLKPIMCLYLFSNVIYIHNYTPPGYNFNVISIIYVTIDKYAFLSFTCSVTSMSIFPKE